MKVHINRKPVNGPWGGGNMWVQSMYRLLPSLGVQVVESNENPDVILLAGLSGENGGMSAIDALRYKAYNKDARVVLRVNENDARKSTTGVDESIKNISKYCDHVVFVSSWLADYFKAAEWSVPTSHIYNGVDREIFCSSVKIQNGKTNIVTHHWSDNFMKGFDFYDGLDTWLTGRQDFTFTYIGRERGTFKNTRVIKPLFGRELGFELGKYDVYVSASRFDPGPNHIIESLSCGIPTYVHSDGGGCVEFSGLDHTYTNFEELLNILSSKNYPKNTAWTPEDWSKCARDFQEVLKKVKDEKRT